MRHLILVVGLLILSTLVRSGDFPYGATYPFGTSKLTSDTGIDNYLLSEWSDWKAAHVTSNGAGGFKRVQRDQANNMDTHSIGMGYGMIFSVYFKDQTLFNDLFSYVQTKLNDHSLLHYQQDSSGNVIGQNSATDADIDIAVALILADKVWGSAGSINYAQKATTHINNLKANNIEAGTNVVKPGDYWGGAS